MENNFTRGTNHDALRQAADANALQNGLPDSAFFSEQGVSTQIGHPLAVGIFTPSNPGSDLTPAQSDARNFINQICDGSTTEINGETVHKVFDIDDPRFLTTQPTSGSGNESGGWTFGDREIFISEHRNNSGVHIAQSDWRVSQSVGQLFSDLVGCYRLHLGTRLLDRCATQVSPTATECNCPTLRDTLQCCPRSA